MTICILLVFFLHLDIQLQHNRRDIWSNEVNTVEGRWLLYTTEDSVTGER